MDGDATADRPANGGLRLWSYDTEGDAVEEVERLANGMGAKHRMYNTGFSGGKLVCRAPCPATLKAAIEDKKGDILKSAAKALNSLGEWAPSAV
jgi:leucine dehydrogenase